MKKPLTIIFLIVILLTSCGPASLPPPTTVPVTSSLTPRPTQTAIPTATPYPPLQMNGPYLLFQRDEQTLVMMDADGIGKEDIQIPKNAYIPRLEIAVSPNGEWLVYFTGTTEEPYDLAINLLNLKNESTIYVTNLMASGYPENLESLTDLIPFNEYHTDCSASLACKLGVIELGFKTSIRQFDWSPNSEEIAFAAQIDGPSSDIYIFNFEDQSIRRLTNELENITFIDWAPSGEKILYSSEEPHFAYPPRPLRIADPKILLPQNPREIDRGVLFWFGEGWVDENSYFLWDGGEGAPPHRFRYIDIKTQQVKVFWKYNSDGFVYLKDLGGIVVNIYPDQEEALLDSLESGTYFVSIAGERTKLADTRFFPVGKQSLDDSFFFFDNEELHTMKVDGTVSIPISTVSIPISKRIGTTDISVSPNKEWFVLNKNEAQIELYSKDLQLIQSWEIQTYETLWRPDSAGIFLSSYPNLYYLSLNDKELKLTDICPSQDCSLGNYIWLP